MGMIQKKDEAEHDLIEGIEIIESGDTPGDEQVATINLVGGASAEDIADAGRRARGEDDVPADERPLNPFGVAEDDEEPADAPQEQAAPAQEPEPTPAPAAEPAARDADAADAAKKSEKVVAAPNAAPKKALSPAIIAAIVVVVAVVAAIAGYFVGAGGSGASGGLTSAVLAEDELDQAVASYTYNGKTTEVTAREAIESQYSLETVANEDGTYPAPSASNTLTYVRNQILLADAASRGIEATDDEMAEYAESHLGTSDFSSMAEQYGVTEDQAREIVRESVTINKLRDQVVPDGDPTAPEMPTEPADGNTETASADYASYIIALAGDEWDSATGTWADEDGVYAQAFAGQTITADSATYSQAMTAYYVAYQQYSDALNEASAAWTDYANTLFVNADLTLFGVFA